METVKDLGATIQQMAQEAAGFFEKQHNLHLDISIESLRTLDDPSCIMRWQVGIMLLACWISSD